MITRTIVVFIKLVILIVPSLQTNSNGTDQITIKQNSTESTTERIHIKKCCPFGQSYNSSIYECENTTEEFSPDVWRDGKLDESANSLNIFHFDIGLPDCETSEEVLLKVSSVNNNKGYYLDADGNLNPNGSRILKPGEHCLDKLTDDDDGTSFVYNAIVCYLPPKQQSLVLSSTCMLISCVFIIATVAVYAILPKLRSSMPGIILITYLIVLFFGFLTLGLMQILNEMYEISRDLRVIWSITIYFFILSSYFWLNVLCFDTWKTLRSTSRRAGKREMMKKFYKYAVYAFGVPALLTIILISLELSDLPPYPYLPLIRYRGARFLVGLSRFIYLYVPLLILCVANSIFFLWTIWNLLEHKRKTKAVLNTEDSARTDQKKVDLKSFVLSLKLFAIMGITWFLEVISSFYPEIQDTVWQYFDAYNVLSGLVIFIIFICKRTIYTQLIDRYKELRGIPKSQSVATMRTFASTNDNLNA